jgi:hypothetical protein
MTKMTEVYYKCQGYLLEELLQVGGAIMSSITCTPKNQVQRTAMYAAKDTPRTKYHNLASGTPTTRGSTALLKLYSCSSTCCWLVGAHIFLQMIISWKNNEQ